MLDREELDEDGEGERAPPDTEADASNSSDEDPAADPIPLVIREIEYLGPMATPRGWRPTHAYPEIAFAGRSNVGKSTLINKLVQRKKLARVSNTPGRTREIHFFRVNQDFVLADLPGYGYAKIAKERRAEWKPLIEGFLKDSAGLRGIVMLLDVRRDPSSDDEHMLDFLAELGLPVIVVVTKVDKLTRGAVAERVAAIAKTLGLDEDQVIAFSAVSGTGRKELAEAVMSLLAQPSWRSS
jgi:GTP-binding protein